MACSPSRHTTYETVIILSPQCHLLILWKQDIKIYTKFAKLIKTGLWERQQTFKDYCRKRQTKLTYKDLTYCTKTNFKTPSHWIILSDIYLEEHVARFYSSIQINSTPLTTITLIHWHWDKTILKILCKNRSFNFGFQKSYLTANMNLPFHNRANINSAIAPFVALTDNAYSKKIYFLWKQKRTFLT